MPCYRVTNRVSGEAYSVEAPYAQDACEALGWMIGDCHVHLVHESPFTDPDAYAMARGIRQPPGKRCPSTQDEG